MKRRPLAPKAKAALWQQQGERCAECHKPIALAEMQDDHNHPLWCGGGNETDNRQGLCDECHKGKTKCEAKARGKMKRLAKGPRQRQGRPMPSRPFGPSRGFDTRLRRKLSGTVEVRT